jgi:hypothetical protein
MRIDSLVLSAVGLGSVGSGERDDRVQGMIILGTLVSSTVLFAQVVCIGRDGEW